MRKKSIRPQKQLLVIVGATGTGKSALAVTLARRFGGEVISADSRQVYRGLDIGTGKLTKREMEGIPHHLLNVASLRRTYTQHRSHANGAGYTVWQYQRDARRAIRAIWKRGKLPILCGGTGLYIRAVVDGTLFPQVPPNPKLRARLARKTATELFTLLKNKDPRRANAIDRHNPRRLIRALEVAHALGNVPRMNAHPIDARVYMLGLMRSNAELERRTRARIRRWLRRGLLAEVKRIPPSRMNELGLVYRRAARLANGEITRNIFIEGLTRDLLKYAKRQRIWFTGDHRIHWIPSTSNALPLVHTFLQK